MRGIRGILIEFQYGSRQFPGCPDFRQKNIQHFLKIETDRTRLWSSRSDLPLADSEASVYGRIEKLKFPRTICR